MKVDFFSLRGDYLGRRGPAKVRWSEGRGEDKEGQ